MNPNPKTEIPGPHGKTIQDHPAVAAETGATIKVDSIKPDGKVEDCLAESTAGGEVPQSRFIHHFCKVDDDLNVEVECKTEPNKSELVILWLFIAAMMILTVVAGYMLWKKISDVP